MLRQLPVSGTHFRRQVPIGPYVADFACLASRLVIELDGSQHARQDRAARDGTRTAWLEREGFKVLRFWNNDIVDNREAVLSSIYFALYGPFDSEVMVLKHKRHRKPVNTLEHPTPARVARRPSLSRGG
jgi:very-short-patch-repair endonuclease